MRMNQYRKLTLIVGLLVILTFAAPATAQTSNDITNEYRATIVTSKPVSDKVILFAYLGVVKAPDKSVRAGRPSLFTTQSFPERREGL
jgi:hypothetical protein